MALFDHDCSCIDTEKGYSLQVMPLVCLRVIELTPFGSMLATSFTSDRHYVPLMDHCNRRVKPCHVHVSHLRHCQVSVNLETVFEYDCLLLLLLVLLLCLQRGHRLGL